VDVPLESIIEQSSFRATVGQPLVSQAENWEEVRFKIEAYLRAWRFPYRSENLAEILRSAKDRAKMEPELCRTEIAIEEADKLIQSHSKNASCGEYDGAVSIEERLALLIASSRGTNSFENPLAYQEAGKKLQLALHPQRPLETHPMTMKTSLSRLPSFRLIAGWAAVVILLVLIFIFTHR
jgi:hypothetical protein